MREMKDSGIRWIGSIPASWSVDKLKFHLVRHELRNPGEKIVLSLYRELGVIPKDSRDDNHNVTSEDTSKYKYVQPGDFVINKMKAWQGSVAVSDYEGIVSPAYFIYNFTDDAYFKRYFHYLLRSCYKDEFMRLSGGIRVGQWDLPSAALDNTMVLIPPLSEQHRIADFLNAKCAEIDALIADIQTQIDTLEQYKRSVITETVTKGLNPNAEMKDSGVVWIGKVPASWRIENPKYHFVQRQERATKEMIQLTASQKYGVVTQAEYMELTGARVVIVQKDFDILKKVCAGDFVIHMRSFQGGLEYSTKTGSISSAYVMLTPKKSIAEPRYYRWFFKSSAYIDALSSTSNLVRDGQAMRWANFIQLPITIPPADEQTDIADFLDAKCAEIDSVVVGKKAQLEVLDAYKKSLIFEYVTGKKEVPETVTVVGINPQAILLAKIVDMLNASRGKIFNQKLLCLCNLYLGLGLDVQYYRYQHGPLDLQLNTYIDTLVSNGWYELDTRNGAENLIKGKKHAEFLKIYGDQFSQHEPRIRDLVQYFSGMKRSQVERFATLFAAWNDFIIDGDPTPSDDQIISEVMTNWTPNKANFSRNTWQNTLAKMKRRGIIPKGLGLHTLPKPKGGMADA